MKNNPCFITIPVNLFTKLVLIVGIAFMPLQTIGQSKFKKNIEVSQSLAFPINSLNSDDFSDLQFLKDEIGEKKIIWLGENDHAIKDINILKNRLIRFLHEEMSFNVVVFESGIANCGLSNLSKSQMNPFEYLYTSILGYWRTEDNCSLMQYFKENELDVAGMDPNYKARFLPKRCYDFIFSENSKLAAQHYKYDSLMTCLMIDKSRLFHSKDTKDKKNKKAIELSYQTDSIQLAYLKILDTISIDDLNPLIANEQTLRVLQIGLKNNIKDLSKNAKDFKDSELFWVNNRERDSLMAANLTYIKDSIYPEEKMIIWAHNVHIQKATKNISPRPFETISYHLPERIKEESFVIGIFADLNIKSCSKRSVFNISRKMNMGLFYLNTTSFKPSYKLDYKDFWTNSNYTDCNWIESGKQNFNQKYDAFIYIPNARKRVLLNHDPFKD